VLQVGVDVVQRWARKGRLKPVSGPGVDECHRYLFRREDVERLRRQHRRAAPQMAKALGISRSQLVARIRQGKLKPISGPGISGCGHYLFIRGSGSYQTVE
jgi:predicted site-specific integrase-resolvase